LTLQEKQRAIQIRRNAELIGGIQEVWWRAAIMRWTVDRSHDVQPTLNFSHADTGGKDLTGTYLSVRVTRAGPNSLVGEARQLCDSCV